MSRLSGKVINLGSGVLRIGKQSVEDRVDHRLLVLRQCLAGELQIDEPIPSSLTKLRKWRCDKLGILPIGSANDFTQSHPIYGARVRELARLLKLLGERKPGKKAKSSPPKDVFDRKAFDHLIEAVTSQWHAERDRCLTEAKRAASAEARVILLRQECEEKDKQIAELRRQIAQGTKRGLSVVE